MFRLCVSLISAGRSQQADQIDQAAADAVESDGGEQQSDLPRGRRGFRLRYALLLPDALVDDPNDDKLQEGKLYAQNAIE